VDSSGHSRIKLSEAANELGCHVETLRERVRAGLLDAMRGPHGAYYVTAAALERMPPIVRSPAPRRFTPEELERSWDAAERLVGMTERTREPELSLLRSLQADPSRKPRLFRLVAAQVLQGAGLTFSEIALELGITARHARRLAARSVSIALRKEIYKQAGRTTKAAATAPAQLVVDEIRRLLGAAGVIYHVRSAKARRARPFPVDTPDGLRQAFRVKKLMTAEKVRLRANGLSEEQIHAIGLAGLGTDELNFLLLYGIPDEGEDS